MKQLKKTLLTLVALFAMTAGAWATDANTVVWDNETWAGWAENVTTHTVGDITITATGSAKAYQSDSSGEPLAMEAGANDAITFTSNGKPFSSIAIQLAYGNTEIAGWTYNSSTWSLEWSGEPTTSVTLSGCNILADVITFTFAAGTALTPDATRTVWTLDAMPAGNVELQVAYFPGMLTLPAKTAEGSIEVVGMGTGGAKAFDVPAAWSSEYVAYTEADLPHDFKACSDDEAAAWATACTDEKAILIYSIGNVYSKAPQGNSKESYEKWQISSALNQGFKIYYTAAPALPAGFDTDGTNIYVEPKTQFQVKAVPATGYHLVSLSDGTNTYDVDADGIATVTMPEGDKDLTLTATFSDEFELTFDDVNFKTNQNITVKVGDADKTLDQDGKLSVKAGQTVTLTAKQGYKFRSVEAKKAGATITVEDVTLDITGCTTWVDVVAKNSDKIECPGNGVKKKGTSYFLTYKTGDTRVVKTEQVKADVEYYWKLGD